MRLVVPEVDYDWGKVKLLAGNRYVMEPRAVGGFLMRVDGRASVEAVDLLPYYPAENYNHKTLTIIRAGGIGDILMLTPLLKAMVDRWPDAHIEVCCGSRSAFCLPSEIDWLPYPATLESLSDKDGILNLTGVVENEFEKHAVHAFGERAGFTDLPLKLHYQPDAGLVGDLKIKYPKKGKARVGIQMRASSPIRSYPHVNEVISLLIQKGIEVVMLGEPNSIIQDVRNDLLLNGSTQGWDMEDSVAFASLCDCVIAPDSAFVHFCCAMNVPVVGLYGSFDYGIRRTEGSPKNYFIQAKGECSPCNHHGEGGLQWPSHGPCNRSGLCNVLAGIPADRVARKAIQICTQ